MNVSTWFFSETTHKCARKLCGNYKLAEFGLSEEDASFLTEMIAGHGLETIRNSWLREGRVSKPGRGGRVDPEKSRTVQLIQNHYAFCEAGKVWVSFIDKPCFRWQCREAL